MKKLCFSLVLFAFSCFFAFGDTNEPEEKEYLLFSLNSSNSFENREQANIQLDFLAEYLKGSNLSSGQILVYGYATVAVNDIDGMNLSRDRAAFVINELQKRGVPNDLFSEPVGYGSVDLWGDNAKEDDKKPNRRVRVLLNINTPVPVTQPVIQEDIDSQIEAEDTEIIPEETTRNEIKNESGAKFPWWILFALLAIVAAIIFFLLKKRKSSGMFWLHQLPGGIPGGL
jgi:hypothetical protein